MNKLLFTVFAIFLILSSSVFGEEYQNQDEGLDYASLTIYGHHGWSYAYEDEYQDFLGGIFSVHPWWLEDEDESFLLGLGVYVSGAYNEGKFYSRYWSSFSLDGGLSLKYDWQNNNTATLNFGIGKIWAKSDWRGQVSWYFKTSLNYNLEKRRYLNEKWWPKTTLNFMAVVPFGEDEMTPEEREPYNYGRLSFQGDWSVLDLGNVWQLSPGLRLGLISQGEKEKFQYKLGVSLAVLKYKDEKIRFYVDVNPVTEYIYFGFVMNIF